ncbi:MAG: hypothetical protein WC761_00255 [Candidatus Paceibacterota bacterium]|jgi:hypothetical protein
MKKNSYKRSKASKGKVERFPIPKDPEIHIGSGKLLESICQQDHRAFASHVVHRFSAGDVVSIARAIVTAAGPRYRLINTIVWLSPEQIEVDAEVKAFALNHVDPTKKAEKVAKSLTTENRFTSQSQRGNVVNRKSVLPENNTKKKVSPSAPRKAIAPNRKSALAPIPNKNKASKTSKISNTPLTLNTKNITMNKKQLRTILAGLVSGTCISITFIGSKAHQSGDYTVVKVKTGRGKGGSKLVELINSFKQVIVTGTPESEAILNMTVNGERHGFSSESEIPVVYAKSPVQAKNLKATFGRLLEAEGDVEIEVESTVADFNGTFTVNKATKLRGRGGQIMLDVENVNTGTKFELWSGRHSGIVTGLTIVGEVLAIEEPASDEDEMEGSTGQED